MVALACATKAYRDQCYDSDMQYTNIQAAIPNSNISGNYIRSFLFRISLSTIFTTFFRLYILKNGLVGPLIDMVFTLVPSPKMRANENKFITDEVQQTWKSLLPSRSTITFPPSSGSQWSETRHICSLQFELPRANLHWFTSLYWLNMNICFSEILGCSLFEHNLILQTCCKPINRQGRSHQPEGPDSTAPGLRPAPAGGWSWRVAAARSTVASCSKQQKNVFGSDDSINALSRPESGRWSYLERVQQALGQVFSSKGESSLIFWAMLTGRGSRTCSTRLP